VVEDDPTNAVLAEAILRRRGGFQVIRSTDPGDVLRFVAEGGLAAVLMDIELEGAELDGEPVDGVELCRRIRELPAGRTLPVIFLTAHAMQGDREFFLFSSGANDYIVKPIVAQDEFIALLRRHIGTVEAPEMVRIR